MPTYVHDRVSSGAETVVDQLAGTAVAFAGKTGRVRAAAVSTVATTTIRLYGRTSGIEIIPNGSSAQMKGTNVGLDVDDFMYDGTLQPGEPIELTIVAAAASTAMVGVRTD